MLKKFLDGLVFGSGFAIAFVAIWFVAGYLITPKITASQISAINSQLDGTGAIETRSSLGSQEIPTVDSKPFHEMTLDDQIKHSSVIALARFERAPDGRMKAIIKEFLKKDPNVTVHYNLGDEYAHSSYYPKDNTRYGDGVIVFFVGSPATMRMSMSFSGDRIHGLGDLPLELLKQKCANPEA